MKKLKVLITLMTLIVLGVVGCSNTAEEGAEEETTVGSGEKQVITIGTSTISRDVLEVAQEVFNENSEDYTLEIQVFDDAVTPNVATEDGSIDGTFHQYESYMENFNEEQNASLMTYGPEVFAFQIGLFSEVINDVSEIEDGMTVALANDATNRALALELLANEGIITLNEEKDVPTILDIEENPHNLEFVEMERLNLANAVDDVDMAIVMTDVMEEAGKDPSTALAYNQEEGIKLVLKEEQPWADELVEALISDEVKTYIEEETNETKAALF